MTTPRYLCTRALKFCGAFGKGQTPDAEDMQDTFDTLNDMVGQWAQKRWLVYHLVDVTFFGSGAHSYSIGPGCDIDTPRPDRIESAFVRMNATRYSGFVLDVSLLDVGVLDHNTITAPPTLQSIDYPLEIITAREDWNLLSYKGFAGAPSSIFYDSGYPSGLIYINPIPGSQYEIHLSLKQPILAFAALDDDLNLPPQYNEALVYSLAARIGPTLFQLPANATTVALATVALNTIRISNAQIPRLKIPSSVAGMSRRGGDFAWGGGSASMTSVGVLTNPITVAPAVGRTSASLGIGSLGQTSLGIA